MDETLVTMKTPFCMRMRFLIARFRCNSIFLGIYKGEIVSSFPANVFVT